MATNRSCIGKFSNFCLGKLDFPLEKKRQVNFGDIMTSKV